MGKFSPIHHFHHLLVFCQKSVKFSKFAILAAACISGYISSLVL